MSQLERKETNASLATLMSMITGFMPARVVHVAAQLGLADLLAAVNLYDNAEDVMGDVTILCAT